MGVLERTIEWLIMLLMTPVGVNLKLYKKLKYSLFFWPCNIPFLVPLPCVNPVILNADLFDLTFDWLLYLCIRECSVLRYMLYTPLFLYCIKHADF